MLRVRLDVNGSLIDELLIVNRGPVDGEADRYEWQCEPCSLRGDVEHVRSLGAHELLRLVLLDHRNQERVRARQ